MKERIRQWRNKLHSAMLSKIVPAGSIKTNELCSITLDNRGVSIAYVTNRNTTPNLQFLETIACTSENYFYVLKELVSRHQLEGNCCSWLLTPDRYQLLQMEELPVPAEEFTSAIRWQIKKLLPFSIEDAYIDRFPIPPANVPTAKKTIMVVASQASYIQPLAEKIVETGLNLKIIDIQEMAMRNINALYEKDGSSTALVYLQEKSSTITITRNGLFYFSRRLDWAWDIFLDKLDSQETLNEYMHKLALEIQRSFDYFQGQWRYPAPTRVLIVPVKEVPISIVSYLTQRLAVTSQNIELNTVLQSQVPLTADIEGQYLPLIGSALRDESQHETAG